MREQTRLLRGQLYGRARRAFIKGFADIQNKKEILSDFKIEDFFHVSLKEYELFGEGKLNEFDLKKIIDRELGKDLNKDYPEHYSVSSDVVNPIIEKITEKVSSFEDGRAQGLGASSGEVIGEALVLFDPKEAMQIKDLSNKILITKTTDPAWVFIMSQCKGLISEKGSLLSHTAIIGRELGIPTVVGLKSVTNSIEQGAKIKINGKTGEVSIIAGDSDGN